MTETEDTTPQQPHHRPFVRPADDRVIAGVCGAVARRVEIDPLIVRIGAVALAFLGGLGLLLYLAGALLIPDERRGATPPGRAATAAGVIALVLAAAAWLPGGFWWGGWAPWGLFPLAVVLALGALAWYLVGEHRDREPRTGTSGSDILRAVVLVGLVLAVSFAVAVAGFWAAGVGGDGWAVALAIGAGVVLLAASFVGRARWLALPALGLALSVGFVTAAGIDLDGGFGERDHRPATLSEVRDRYELGAGELVIDLRDVEFGSVDRDMDVRVGMGELIVLVPEDVCVSGSAHAGMGEVEMFDNDNAGVDVDKETRTTAPAGTAQLVLDAEVGIGHVAIGTEYDDHGRFGRHREGEVDGTNAACEGGARATS